MKTLLLVFFLISIQFSYSQNYKTVDAVVDTYPKKFKSIEHFAQQIESDFKTDINKTRAAYYWISNHISYDFKMFAEKGSAYKVIKYDTESEYQEKQLQQELKYAEYCLRKQKAVCEGYSQLLRFTLKKLNIPCEVIVGTVKNSYREIGRVKRSSNHAWNAVKLDNQWKLIDATWSTGNRPSSPLEFEFADTYFLTQPELFILDHFPMKKEWQLLEHPMDRSDFFQLPKIYYSFFKSKIDLGKAAKGLIAVKTKDTITLKFDHVMADQFYAYAFKGDSSTRFLFEKVNNEFVVHIPHDFKRTTFLTLYSEGKSILRYKIEADK
jgi:transglutaminase/protease-like cytokinesis protein 3